MGRVSFADEGRPARARALFALFDALMALAAFLLRLGGRPVKEGIVRSFGDIGYLFGRRWKRISLINLDLAYGERLSERDKRRIVRGMFRHFIRTGLDMLFDDAYWSPEKFRRAAEGQGAEVLAEARRTGLGYVSATGHLGNIELLQRAIGAQGFENYTIYKPFHGAWFDRYVARKRLRSGVGLIQTPEAVETGKRRSIRGDVEAAWAKGLGVNLACDQYTARGSVPIDFLGVPETPAQIGVFAYAVARRIPLTFHAFVYDAKGYPRWIAAGPFPIEDRPGGREATVLYYVQFFADWLGERIREFPEQYAWGHRRFDRRYYAEPRVEGEPAVPFSLRAPAGAHSV